ncbi:hypothetical protein SAY87_004840 [Trapa incisa]|uniref:RRM domain-containing protein n=1 Tax=Trapa incisa TaxID=236973 RepID=A0AAN7JVA6_9MYRT|nr:hypothetical protein SAY87_004840 [Trapa incisa]
MPSYSCRTEFDGATLVFVGRIREPRLLNYSRLSPRRHRITFLSDNREDYYRIVFYEHMDSNPKREYDAFRERVKRTIYIDNLSPQVNESVLRNAFDQYGSVKGVQFIPKYAEPHHMGQSALVEVDTPQQAQAIIEIVSSYPFMILGMPRPVRARPAELEMFGDHPPKPGRKIEIRWVDPNDPDFEVAQKLKQLIQKHADESAFMLKQQLAEEIKLAQQQAETLKANNEKYMLIDGVMTDGSARRLASYYDMKAMED